MLSKIRKSGPGYARIFRMLNFLIFCTMMQNGNAQNVTEPDFRKKIFLKYPGKPVFWHFPEILSLVFSDFSHKDA